MELFQRPRVGMVMTMVRDLLLYVGAVLLCAPLLIYLLDSIIGLARRFTYLEKLQGTIEME